MNKKKIGILSATFLGISSIIGSGWLFAPYKSASVAGPAAIYSWIIGAGLIMLLALCFAEVASLYPKRGLTAIVPTLSHNKYFGFPFAIANWLGIVAVIGLEADATVEYLINLIPSVKPYLFVHGQLTWWGDSCSVLLVILFTLVNYWGAKTLVKTNNILTVLKILVPVITGIVIISVAFSPDNFTMIGGSWTPYGASSIVTAILTTGIIVAFNGFQTVVSFASEIKRPYRTIPVSLIISVVVCLGIYLLLQFAFVGAIPSQQLATQGWSQLSFNAPMVQIPLMLGLGVLTSIVYFGATIGPSGTAIAFTGTATRMFTAMSRNQQLPAFFNKMHPEYNISRRSLVMNALLAIVFLLVFRSWGQLAQVLSLFHVVSYLPIPIALCVFRDCMGARRYPFRLPGGRIIALSLFVIFTYLFTMGDVNTVTDIIVIFSVFQTVFIALNVKSIPEFTQAFRQCSVLLGYFLGLLVLVLISPSHSDIVSNAVFIGIVVVFSLTAFYGLTNYERNDAEIINSAVTIYRE